MQKREKALLRRIHNVIEEMYTKHLVQKDAGLIKHNIPIVLDYLPTNYGKIPLEEVKQKES